MGEVYKACKVYKVFNNLQRLYKALSDSLTSLWSFKSL